MVKFDDLILKQTVNCIKGGTHEVVLPEELVESKLDYNALPLTINAMCLIGKKVKYFPKFYLSSLLEDRN